MATGGSYLVLGAAAHPLPGVAKHVVKSVRIGFVRHRWRNPYTSDSMRASERSASNDIATTTATTTTIDTTYLHGHPPGCFAWETALATHSFDCSSTSPSLCHVTSQTHQIKSHHITSHHITSHHITSHITDTCTCYFLSLASKFSLACLQWKTAANNNMTSLLILTPRIRFVDKGVASSELPLLLTGQSSP
jgi:hypothetical protein